MMKALGSEFGLIRDTFCINLVILSLEKSFTALHFISNYLTQYKKTEPPDSSVFYMLTIALIHSINDMLYNLSSFG